MKFKGSVKVKNNLKKFTSFSKNMDGIINQANAMVAVEIRNEAVNLLNENGDGPVAIRYLPKREVHVSPPGTPPNTDTGRLVQSIKFERDKNAYLVGTNLKYGAWLEFGTRDMAPRPWLSVAFARVTKDLKLFYDKAMENFIKGFR